MPALASLFPRLRDSSRDTIPQTLHPKPSQLPLDATKVTNSAISIALIVWGQSDSVSFGQGPVGWRKADLDPSPSECTLVIPDVSEDPDGRYRIEGIFFKGFECL